MESVQILAQVNKENGAPQDWLVFTLIRQKVIVGILGWVFGAIAGGLLFAFMAPIMIPHNYQIGAFSAVVSTLILAMVLYVCLGSIWAMIADILRLRHAEQHVIIITPEDFVKQEGKKIVHVPLEYVKYVTARGAPQVDRSSETAREDARTGNVGENVGSLIFGRRVAESGRRGLIGRKRMRTPTTLAFIDSRDDHEVIVVTDKSYGDPHYIAAHLKQYAAARVQNMVVKDQSQVDAD
jgi:hypothetical protein